MRLTNRGKIFFTALAIITLSIIIIIVAVSGRGSDRAMQVSACNNAEAYVYRGDKTFVASQGMALETGDRISVKSGNIVLLIDNGVYTTVYGNTDIVLETKGKADDGTITADISNGEIFVNINEDMGQGTYVCTTKSATITGQSYSSFVVTVDAMTDLETTRIHVLNNTATFKMNATKLNAEVTQSVPSGYTMETGYVTTTGKCEIKESVLGDVSKLSLQAAQSVYDAQGQGQLSSVYSQAALADRIAQGGVQVTEGNPSGGNGTPTPPPATTSPEPPEDTTGGIVIITGDVNCTHDYKVDDRQSKDATCVADGYKYHECSKCGSSYLETIPKSRGEHKYDSGVHTDGDCTKAGYTTYKCTLCSNTKVENDTTPADHTYDSGVHTDGDCTKFGFTTYKCTKCGETKVVNDTAKGNHKKVETVVSAANCTEVSYTVVTCENCDHREVVYGAAGPHVYGDDHLCDYCETPEPGFTPPAPTDQPTTDPTAEPSAEPTAAPTAAPTQGQ